MTIPNSTYRLLIEKFGDSDPAQFVGNKGEVFYDPNTPSLKLSDGETPGGISIGGSGSGTLNINTVDESPYILQLSDSGGGVLVSGGGEVVVPSDDQLDFPIGTIITLIIADSLVDVRPASDGDTSPTIILAGSGGSSSAYWGIPELNIASLIKVVSNGWLISGPGIFDND